MYRPIPYDPEGYALATDSLEVHTRYAKHVSGLRKVRTIDGVYTMIGEYAEPVPCDICYPPPPKAPKTRKAEPTKVIVPAGSGISPEASAYLDGLTAESVTLGPVDPEPED